MMRIQIWLEVHNWIALLTRKNPLKVNLQIEGNLVITQKIAKYLGGMLDTRLTYSAS